MPRSFVARVAVLTTALLAPACSLDHQSIPTATGPSEFGLSVRITATPQLLPRDGASQAVITIEVLDKSDTLLVRAFASGLPEGTRYVVGRAIGYQRSGQLDRSIKLLTDAAIAKPDEPEIWLFRGRYRMDQRDCASALSDFQRATRLAPANAAAFASQGIAELCVNDVASAQKSFERSLALDANQPKVREYLRSTQTRGRS